MRDSTLREPMSDLRNDLYAVARDAEALLKATAEVTNDQVQEIRRRTEQTLRETLDHLDTERMRNMARRTNRYIRDNSWAVVGAAAGIGLVIGLMAWRNRSSDMRDMRERRSSRENMSDEMDRGYGGAESRFGAREAEGGLD